MDISKRRSELYRKLKELGSYQMGGSDLGCRIAEDQIRKELEELKAMEEKVKLYRAGKYVFSVPPGPTSNWDVSAWIKHIDKCNGWRP